MGHVVTLHFHSFSGNKEKSTHYINETKPHNCSRPVKLMGKNKYSEPQVYLHKLRKLKSVGLCPALHYHFYKSVACLTFFCQNLCNI